MASSSGTMKTTLGSTASGHRTPNARDVVANAFDAWWARAAARGGPPARVPRPGPQVRENLGDTKFVLCPRAQRRGYLEQVVRGAGGHGPSRSSPTAASTSRRSCRASSSRDSSCSTRPLRAGIARSRDFCHEDEGAIDDDQRALMTRTAFARCARGDLKLLRWPRAGVGRARTSARGAKLTWRMSAHGESRSPASSCRRDVRGVAHLRGAPVDRGGKQSRPSAPEYRRAPHEASSQS